ncbi:MAG: peroxiredoxin-like family protein [Opitutaceae bacterium]
MFKQITFTIFATAVALLPAVLTAAPIKATEVNPIEVGSTAPDVSFTKADGSSIELKTITAEKPTVIVFYRGSWCPYCTRHLAALGDMESQLLEKGYQIIAVSPDSPQKVKEYEASEGANYAIYSDAFMEAASAFGLAFKVDERRRKKLASYNIDIEDASGKAHHLLPVPAVYIVGQDGLIKFRYYNPNYKTRLSADDILKAIE